MAIESKGSKFVRGLVKLVFVACYIAFMYASIHKVAYFFASSEEQNGNGLGSYAIAGAFDLTALVTTIGVMFFRKSMPRYIQIIVWLFIIAIAAFSYAVNWEYDAHFQSVTLALQHTGATTPVYDQQGNLHYVPVMKENATLVFLNPLLTAGFTIFSLIYSVVAEFFGSKPLTVQELNQKKQYLEETRAVRKSIAELESQDKGASIFDMAKGAIKGGKDVLQELTKKEEKIALEEKPDDVILEGKLSFVVDCLQDNPAITDEQLAEKMNLSRPAAARFWRLKAEEMLNVIGNITDNITPAQTTSTDPAEEAQNTDPIPVVKQRITDDLSGNITEDITGDYPAENSEDSQADNKLSGRIAAQVIRYPNLSLWQPTSPLSATIEQIIEVSGHSRKMILNRIADGNIKRTRNPNLYRVDSVLSWMEKTPPVKTKPAGQIEDKQADNNGRKHDTIDLNGFVEMPL